MPFEFSLSISNHLTCASSGYGPSLSGNNHAWDVALYVVLHDFRARYAEYRTYAHLLQYTDVLQNLGGQLGFDPTDAATLRKFARDNPHTYLVHWSPKVGAVPS